MTSEVKIQKIVAMFADATRKHYEATMRGDWRQTNKHAKRIATAFRSITETGEEARNALLQLAQSDDDVVASMAAAFSLKYATEEAKLTLRRIAKRNDLLGFEAEQALQRWEEGTWQLE